MDRKLEKRVLIIRAHEINKFHGKYKHKERYTVIQQVQQSKMTVVVKDSKKLETKQNAS